MIREQIVVGEDYAVINSTNRDRTAARKARILSLGEGNYVLGEFEGEHTIIAIPTRMVRSTWDAWVVGLEPERNVHHQPKEPSDAKRVKFLRRLTNHPYAGPDVVAAARRELESL